MRHYMDKSIGTRLLILEFRCFESHCHSVCKGSLPLQTLVWSKGSCFMAWVSMSEQLLQVAKYFYLYSLLIGSLLGLNVSETEVI